MPIIVVANSVTEKISVGMSVIVIVTVFVTVSETGIVTGNVEMKKHEELNVAGTVNVTETVIGLGVVRLGVNENSLGSSGVLLASPLALCATSHLLGPLATAAGGRSQKMFVILVKTMINIVINDTLPGSVASPAEQRVVDRGYPAPTKSAEEGAVT